MENNLKDLKVFGSTDNCGGVYNNVIINGSGDINGDLECNSIKINGSGDVRGNLKAGFVKINGSGDIRGDINAEDIIINGSADIRGEARCKTLKINGSGDVDGCVYAEEVTLKGYSDIGGCCEAEIFNAKGAFDIKDTLNAGEINISLKGKSNMKEIFGGRIEVRKSDEFSIGSFIKIFSGGEGRLKCDIIEGDEIFLENTSADIVRGNNIIIGVGCDIKRIEYRNNFDGSKNSKTTDIVKL